MQAQRALYMSTLVSHLKRAMVENGWPIAITSGVCALCMLSGTAPAVMTAVCLKPAYQNTSSCEVSLG